MASRLRTDDVAAALIYALAALAGPAVVSWLSASTARLGEAAFALGAASSVWSDGMGLLIRLLGLLAAGAGAAALVAAALRRRILGPARLTGASAMATGGSLLLWALFGGLLVGSWLSLSGPATEGTAAAIASLVRAILGTAAAASAARVVAQAGSGTGTGPATSAGS